MNTWKGVDVSLVCGKSMKTGKLSELYSSQIPHVCAEETFERKFWNNFCTGISSHPNGSADGPSNLTCLQMLCCNEGMKKASLLKRREEGI